MPTGQANDDVAGSVAPELIPPDRPPRPWWQTALRWAPVAILVGGGLAAFFFGVGDYLSLSEIIKARARLLDFVADQPVTTAAAYAAIYILAVIFSIPGGSVITIVGGVLFGGVAGGLITTFAATAASIIVFLVARSALGDGLLRRIERLGPRIASFTERMRENALVFIIFLRLVPVMPYWASNVLPAALGVRLPTYAAATLVGLLPWTVSFAFFGVALDEAIAAQELANPGCADAGTCTIDPAALASGQVLTGIAIALLAIVPVVFLSWRHRRKARADAASAGDEGDTAV